MQVSKYHYYTIKGVLNNKIASGSGFNLAPTRSKPASLKLETFNCYVSTELTPAPHHNKAGIREIVTKFTFKLVPMPLLMISQLKPFDNNLMNFFVTTFKVAIYPSGIN